MRQRKISIPVVAMSDIAFLLLIFLMLSSITSSKKTVKLNLPQIQDVSKVNIKKSINIFIDKTGKYYLNDREMNIEQLQDKIETKTALNKNVIIFIYGDEDVEYKYVDIIIKLLQSNQLRNCIFVSRKSPETKK